MRAGSRGGWRPRAKSQVNVRAASVTAPEAGAPVVPERGEHPARRKRSDTGPPRWLGDTRPPVVVGNQLARKHGAWSARRSVEVAEQVETIADDVAAHYPWTRSYQDERLSYARAVVDEQSIRDYLDTVGLLDQDHVERGAVRTLHRFAARADRLRSTLGINPASHARILEMLSEVLRRHPEASGSDGSLDALLVEGRAALQRGAERPVAPGAHLDAEHGDTEAQTATQAGVTGLSSAETLG